MPNPVTPVSLQPVMDEQQSFAGGQDSFVLPINLGPNEYITAENVMNRGGVIQTRPDSKSLFDCPCGSAQGCVLFTPANGIPYLVFASYGKVYVSPKPFHVFTQLPNIQFSPISDKIAWAVCQQSTDYDASGNMVFLSTPYPVLVMQDDNTRAAFWDGVTNRHLNPTTSPNPNSTIPGYDETKIGLWMAWSNNRLWVSRGNQVFASDIGNPLKFTEAQYLNEARAFYLPNECTGMTPTPDNTGILCFTLYEGVFIKSSVQDRTQWLSQADGVMQNTMLPHTGCTSHRSLVTQYGLLWWFTKSGLINLNAAMRENASSKFEATDFEMFDSKYYMGTNLDSVCGVAHENFLLESVASGDKLNRHTWVLDQNPAAQPRLVENIYGFEFTNAWAGRWTGWRPVEWTKGMVDGEEKVFFQSIDYDSNVRIWQAFSGRTGTDNGVPIQAYFLGRDHNFKSLERKKFRWAEFSLREVLGTPSIMVAYASRRGTYTPIFYGDLCASNGQVYYDTIYSDARLFAGNRVQTRIFRTQDAVPPSSCNSCGIESFDPNNIDTQFSLLFMWSGKLGVEWYRILAIEDPKQEGGSAGCIEEACPRSLNDAGCSAISLFADGIPFTLYTATKSFSLDVGAYTYSATSDASSFISQGTANNIALAEATAQVLSDAGYIL